MSRPTPRQAAVLAALAAGGRLVNLVGWESRSVSDAQGRRVHHDGRPIILNRAEIARIRALQLQALPTPEPTMETVS